MCFAIARVWTAPQLNAKPLGTRRSKTNVGRSVAARLQMGDIAQGAETSRTQPPYGNPIGSP